MLAVGLLYIGGAFYEGLKGNLHIAVVQLCFGTGSVVWAFA